MAVGGRSIKKAMYQCMSCGKKYYNVNAAERVMDTGCSKCGDSNIDLFVEGEWFFYTKPQTIVKGGLRRAS